MMTSSFSLKISKWDREKLQYSWQGNARGNKRFRRLETSIRGHKVQAQSLDRLQEFEIFYESIEAEQKTSKMGIISIKIWLYLKTYFRNKNGEGRWIK